MSKDTKYVIRLVIMAFLCGSIPIVVPMILGMGIQSGAWSNQLLHSVIFLTFTKLSSLYLLVSIIGLALSIYFRKRNPQKFRLASISFAVLLAGTIVTAILSAWIDVNYAQAGIPASQTAIIYSSVNCIYTLSQIATWAIILVIIFSKKFNPNDEIVHE